MVLFTVPGEDAQMASDDEGDGERAGPSIPIDWSEDETAPGESGGAGAEDDGDELDGLPVFGVDQDPWDMDVPSMGEPYPETSNTGSDSRMTGQGEEREQQGERGLDEGSEDGHPEKGVSLVDVGKNSVRQGSIVPDQVSIPTEGVGCKVYSEKARRKCMPFSLIPVLTQSAQPVVMYHFLHSDIVLVVIEILPHKQL